MKFTCDSCGAQYLIADEKIGARGVKVRCKKCTHVIILRPSELATAKPDNSNGGGPMTGGSAASVPVAPSVAAMQAVSSSMLPNDVVAATSSDLGLSQEFMALGFDEPHRPEPRAATLSVGLDLQTTPSVHGDTSPFSAERAGGSLDLVPHETQESEATAVQARPTKPFGEEETEMIGDPEGPPAPSLDDLAAAVGLGQSTPEMSEGEEASTRVENLADLAASEAASGPSRNDVHEEEDATLAFDNPAERDVPAAAILSKTHEVDDVPLKSGPLASPLAEEGLGFGAAFGTSGDSAIDDIRSSLEAEMDGLSEGDEDLAANTVVAPSPVSEADFDAPASGADALAALADDEDEPKSEPEPQAPAPSVEGLGDGLHVAGLGETPFEGQAEAQAEAEAEAQAEDDDDIAGEIGSAFEAMFAGEDGGVGSELEALQEALGAEGTNKAETRVFDTEAMAKVEAEQDRAGTSAEHDAVQAKEWFVAIEEEQIGPLSKDEVQAHWDDGKLQPDSLCWRAGMGDWTAIKDTEPLAGIVPPAPEPRVPTVIGADASATPEAADESDDDLSALSAAAESAPEPPQIKPEPEPVAEPRAASEPAWRPSAASALASLAAEELSDDEPAALAPALGATPVSSSPSTDGIKAIAASGALEKLLEGEPDKSVASQFGAAEQSESMVRPLPRRADTVSSLPLRDPTAEKPKSKGMLYAVVGGFALLILSVLGVGMMLKGGDEAPKTPAGALAKAPKGELAMSATGVVEVDSAAKAKKAAEAKMAAEAEAIKKAAEAKVLADAEAAKAAEAKVLAAEAKVAKKPKKKRGTRRRRRTPKREPVPEVVRAPAPEPVKAVARRRSGSSEDDLLGAAAPRRRRPRVVETEPELQDQLDDSDVLSVLRSNRRDVKRCLKAQASADPSLEGTMTVELVIRRSGRPKGVRVREDKFKRSAVGTCMRSAVKKWRFPKFSGKAMPLDFPVRVRAR